MARIRNIKPDFWTDEKLVELEPIERLLFIGLWNFADDKGYLPYSPKRIKMQVFPGDSIEISRGIQSLISGGQVTLYDSAEGKVLHITNWDKHQKVSNPSQSKYEELNLTEVSEEPRNNAEIGSESLEDSVSSTEDSRELHKEREGERERVVKSSPSPATPSRFDEFWSHYPRKVGKDDARKAYRRAIKRAAAQDIIDGCERFGNDPNIPEKQFIPHAEKWLNRGGWDDEPLPSRHLQSVSTRDDSWMTR